MDSQNLRSLLEQLHQEIAANPPTDERSRELLLGLQQDIQRSVGDTPAAPEVHGLRERVQEILAGYEGKHPQSVAAWERVFTLLSNFGL